MHCFDDSLAQGLWDRVGVIRRRHDLKRNEVKMENTDGDGMWEWPQSVSIGQKAQSVSTEQTVNGVIGRNQKTSENE